MRVTRRMVLDNRTPRGGFSRGQLAALGVPWPPKAHWIHKFEGAEIPDKDWAAFLAASNPQG